MSKWLNYYSFDVMGDLAWGQPYGMLESGQQHFAIKLLSEGMDPLALNFPPWFFRTLTAIPGLSAGYFKLINFCNQQLDDRMKVHQQKKKEGGDPDIATVLIDHFQSTAADKDPNALPLIQGDARLIIVAGSDTTAATLSHCFYHLAAQPEVVTKLREELSTLVGGEGDVQNQKIQDAEYLNGVINETLRLNPPVPSGVFRKTPKEGVMIADRFIAGDTVIQVPTYVLGHGTSPDSCRLSPRHPYVMLTTFHRRSKLHRSRILRPRTLVHPSRIDQAQRRLRALLHWPIRMYRQEPGVDGSTSPRVAAGDAV